MLEKCNMWVAPSHCVLGRVPHHVGCSCVEGEDKKRLSAHYGKGRSYEG